MADYEGIFNWLMKIEDSSGRAVIKDLGDGAGLTRLGLTQKNFGTKIPAAFWTEATTTVLAYAEAKQVYGQEFWTDIHGDQIILDDVAASFLSFVVNGNERKEHKIVQEALGLEPDGVVGPQTVAALNQPGAGQKIRLAQLQWYEEIYATNPARNAQWIEGWRRRASLVYPATL